MSYDTLVASQNVLSPLMEKLLRERKIARDFQERRHSAWDEIYELNRCKTKTNRLTQRQSVVVPLMKETIKTLLSKIDDPPNIEWKEKSGDTQKEIFLQEIWQDSYKRNNLEGIDIQDKKTVLMYGRGFKKLNWKDGQVTFQALDIYDVVIDPKTDPLDIETARFIIHQNIFKPLREILADERYSKEGREKLKIWKDSPSGMVQSGSNKEEWEKKMERLKSMGVDSSDFPYFAGGDVIVHLVEHYTHIWNAKEKKFEKRVIVYADDTIELADDKLEDLLGVNFYPFVSWAEDIETSDVWSDGPADLVRIPNKLVNIWFSQLVENRTLRNFQMHWYDATIQGYQPQTYEPGPGKMLPAPGNPRETIMPVEISGLDETFGAIDFVTKLVERGTSATAIEKGVSEKSQITLGEVKTLVGKATERVLSMAKFYRRSWEELAVKWYEILDANADKAVTLHKKSMKGEMWEKKVYPSDWRSKSGFEPIAVSTSEQEDEKTKSIQRFQFLLTQFPQNAALRRIAQRRMLDVVDLTSEEIREIVEEDKQQMELAQKQAEMEAQMAQMQAQVQTEQPQMQMQEQPPTAISAAPVADEEVEARMQQLLTALSS